MLGQRIARHHTRVYLVNTGWTGGPYGVGSRIKLAYTRAMVTAALTGTIDDAEFRHDAIMNLDVPTSCPGVPDGLLNPRDSWDDAEAYDIAARKLACMFRENCERKYPDMSPEVKAAGPQG